MTADDLSQSPKMVACAVTGKLVPEDELVTIQGQRVCAEGKAILLEKLRAGDALPGEGERPTVGRRFGCILLDSLIVMVPFAIINTLVVGTSSQPGTTPGTWAATMSPTAGLIGLIGTLVQLVYFGQMHGSIGRSVGKMAGKLRVVNLDGSPITPATGYIRALGYVGPQFLTGLAMIVRSAPLYSIVAPLVIIYGIVDALFALFDRKNQRALHDRIAGTRVIMEL